MKAILARGVMTSSPPLPYFFALQPFCVATLTAGAGAAFPYPLYAQMGIGI